MISSGTDRQLEKAIVSGLREINPDQGMERLFKGIYLREDIYNGPYAQQFPEIVLIFSDQYSGQEVISRKIVKDIPPLSIPGPAHRLEGIIMARGPGIKKGYNQDAQIYDIAPTVYHLMRIPVPDNVDGTVLLDILEPKSGPARREIVYKTYQFRPSPRFGWEEGQEDEIKERLKSLGYLD